MRKNQGPRRRFREIDPKTGRVISEHVVFELGFMLHKYFPELNKDPPEETKEKKADNLIPFPK